MQVALEGLFEEYASVVEDCGIRARDAGLISALVERCDWTPAGAKVVLMLARRYGTFVLQNALGLAEALGIEDGVSEL